MGTSAMICNACGEIKPTSREHLFHVATARVLFRDPLLTREQRDEKFRAPYWRDYRLVKDPLDGEGGIRSGWVNQEIDRMVCADCNRRLARIEERAGANLYAFTHLGARADPVALRPWAHFFAMKLWMSHKRREPLERGPLLPVLNPLLTEEVNIGVPVRVARIDGSPRKWNFAGTAGHWNDGEWKYIHWVLCGVIWFVVAAPAGTDTGLPVKTIELDEPLRFIDLPMTRQRALRRLFGGKT